ncbi:serine-arginine protein 55-like [Artemia franciscana]|uniref:RRM domain-containing protein n=2 Tax=Artemia franciscana TaxID=6661 RepID=A0AA88HB99_ARTSF|nr:hypothetical protein QYM36_015871 [Artemia franciscana]
MAGTRVYIGGLGRRAIERDVERFFKGYGRIRQVLLKNGYAFVDFDDRRDAEDSVHDLNGRELMGERVTVEHARGIPRSERMRNERYDRRDRGDRDYYDRRRASGRYDPPSNTKYRLIIENLSSRATWRDVKDYMRKAGEVTFADAHRKRKNEGVVDFATRSDMKNALDSLDDTELFGRRIRLVEDRSIRESYSRSRSPRSRSRTRDRSRTASKSRSKSRERSAEVSRRERSEDRNGEEEKARSRTRSPSRNRVDRSVSRSRSRSKSRGDEDPRSPRRPRSRSASRDVDED